MSSWASFKPFAGKLDPSVLRLLLDSQSKPDYKATNLYLAQWIYGLRRSPEDYGIPKSSVQDVIKILNIFFPEPAQNQSIEPLRIRSDPNILHSQAGIAPVSVNFGPANGTVLISDATNALAYIFSIVTPSVSGPTIDNYYLPLTICYAWFLYLLFLFPPSSPTPVLTNVPSEACVLYLPSSSMQSSSPSPVFCLGATWSGADPADSLASGMLYTMEITLDDWRSDQYTTPAFARNPDANIPVWTPRLRVIAARRLNEYILGKKGNNSKITPFLDPLFSGVLPGGDLVGLPEYITLQTTTIVAEAKQPGLPVMPDFLISHTLLSPKLMNLLLAVFDASEDISDTLKLLQAFSALIEFYITPHVYDLLAKTELPLGTTKAIITGLMSTLPTLLLPSLLKKLQSLQAHLTHTYESKDPNTIYIESLYWIKDDKPYGRGSEAFPTYALSSTIFGDALPNKKLSTIQGVKLQVRALGQAIAGGAFKTEFSSTNLDDATFQIIDGQASKDPVISPPDAESQVLLQQAQTRANNWLPVYNSDAARLCSKTFAQFNA